MFGPQELIYFNNCIQKKTKQGKKKWQEEINDTGLHKQIKKSTLYHWNVEGSMGLLLYYVSFSRTYPCLTKYLVP